MALTLEKEQRLESAGIVDYYQTHCEAWTKAATDAYEYIKKGFDGNAVRQDDVFQPLRSVVEIDTNFRNYRSEHKLRQKYWIDYFTELVIDRTWDDLIKEESGDE